MSKQKNATTQDMRKKEVKELMTEFTATVRRMAVTKLEMMTGKMKDTNALMRLRKTAARIKTVLHEKQQLLMLEKKN